MARKTDKETTATATAAETATGRVTRSSTRRAENPTPAEAEQPKKKKAKTTKTMKEAEAPPPAEKKSMAPEVEDEGEPEAEVVEGGKRVIIEHCKQCNSFKTRAILVKDGLEKGVKGIKVLVNPEKPRRGCFEIREENGETFISLLDMKRPFKPMKDLDMDKVISDIIVKIK